MSSDTASSSEGATVIKHELSLRDETPVHVRVPIRDEFAGEIVINYTFSETDARKVVDLAPSVARLYFGHEMGVELQISLKIALDL